MDRQLCCHHSTSATKSTDADVLKANFLSQPLLTWTRHRPPVPPKVVLLTTSCCLLTFPPAHREGTSTAKFPSFHASRVENADDMLKYLPAYLTTIRPQPLRRYVACLSTSPSTTPQPQGRQNASNLSATVVVSSRQCRNRTGMESSGVHGNENSTYNTSQGPEGFFRARRTQKASDRGGATRGCSPTNRQKP